MIRQLVKLGKWLDSRFPEKVHVSAADYAELKADILRCKEQAAQIDLLIQRLSVVETTAVHKQAVQDLIAVVTSLKDEYVSLKASLGMARITDNDIQALLNGNPVQGE